MINLSIEFINDEKRLGRLVERISSESEIALDVETVNWWNRQKEQIALIQLAYRSESKAKVAVVDALAGIDLSPLRGPLELTSLLKVAHNAVFDTSKLSDHLKFNVAPVYDTMIAARRNKEKRYSLKVQAETHLNLHLDKTGQRSDWSKRPLDQRQLQYAALDAYSTLLLYENQIKRNLDGSFQAKSISPSRQGQLPLSELLDSLVAPAPNLDAKFEEEKTDTVVAPKTHLSPASQALLGIITELPTRYHPDHLAVSVGEERVGMAGWLVDRFLGKDAELDEETAKLTIADLCEKKLVRITETRRLEATDAGQRLWQTLK